MFGGYTVTDETIKMKKEVFMMKTILAKNLANGESFVFTISKDTHRVEIHSITPKAPLASTVLNGLLSYIKSEFGPHYLHDFRFITELKEVHQKDGDVMLTLTSFKPLQNTDLCFSVELDSLRVGQQFRFLDFDRLFVIENLFMMMFRALYLQHSLKENRCVEGEYSFEDIELLSTFSVEVATAVAQKKESDAHLLRYDLHRLVLNHSVDLPF